MAIHGWEVNPHPIDRGQYRAESRSYLLETAGISVRIRSDLLIWICYKIHYLYQPVWVAVLPLTAFAGFAALKKASRYWRYFASRRVIFIWKCIVLVHFTGTHRVISWHCPYIDKIICLSIRKISTFLFLDTVEVCVRTIRRLRQVIASGTSGPLLV